MEKYSVIFCGTPDFAVPSLQALAKDPQFEISLVITQPDKPVGRKQELTPPAVKQAALQLHLPLSQPETINDPAYRLSLTAYRCDFLIVVAYGAILSQDILDLPTIAPINLHGSILPRWRGASPVEHAILAGDKETGITIQIMAAELDAGPILATKTTPIGPSEATPELKSRLCLLGAGLLIDTLKKPLNPVPQPTDGITFCKKLTREDGNVDPKTMTAEEIDRRVRALNPWPGVLCIIDGQELKILETSLEQTPQSIPLPCARNTTLHLVMVQPPGKKPMSGKEWERGNRM